MKYFLSLLLIFFSCLSFSQNPEYIKELEADLSLRLFLENKTVDLEHQVNDETEGDYFTNTPTGLGFGFNRKWYGLSVAIGLPNTAEKRQGKTRGFDLRYNLMTRKVVVDAFFYRYRGFYKEAKMKNITIYPDMRNWGLGFSGYYLFNGDKYSINALMAQNERQLKSAGSFMLGLNFFANRITADSTSTLSEYSRIVSYQVGPNVGYAHTFVISKKFFIGMFLAIGINITDKKGKKYKTSIAPAVFPKIAFGYNSDKWALSISVSGNQFPLLRTETDEIRNFIMQFRFIYVKKLNFSKKTRR